MIKEATPFQDRLINILNDKDQLTIEEREELKTIHTQIMKHHKWYNDFIVQNKRKFEFLDRGKSIYEISFKPKRKYDEIKMPKQIDDEEENYIDEFIL